MTCIAGFTEGDTTYIGADSAVSWGPHVEIHPGAKLFIAGKANEFLIGCAGSVRFEQAVRFHFQPPDLSSRHQPDDCKEDWYPMMVLEFVTTLRAVLKEHGLLVPKKESADVADGECLVAVRGQLFEIDCGFTVCRWESRIHTIGSGADVARGALYATFEAPDVHASTRMLQVLEIAERCSTGVRGPHFLGTSTRKETRIVAL